MATVAISPSDAQDLMIGEMVTFMATARSAAGTVLNGVSFTWTSSDTAVVTITSAGVATGRGRPVWRRSKPRRTAKRVRR